MFAKEANENRYPAMLCLKSKVQQVTQQIVRNIVLGRTRARLLDNDRPSHGRPAGMGSGKRHASSAVAAREGRSAFPQIGRCLLEGFYKLMVEVKRQRAERYSQLYA
jgi:hypothetical protein